MSTAEPKAADHAKRDAILDAALALFAERGYHGTAVPLVAARAGVGAGTLYRYFGSKEALVNALFRKWKTALGTCLLDKFPVDQPVREQFREVWKRLAVFERRHPQAFEFLEMHHHDYLDADSLAVEKAMLEPIKAFLEHAQRQELVKPLPPELLGALVFGGFMGLVRAARRGLLALSPRTLADAETCLWETIRR